MAQVTPSGVHYSVIYYPLKRGFNQDSKYILDVKQGEKLAATKKHFGPHILAIVTEFIAVAQGKKVVVVVMPSSSIKSEPTPLQLFVADILKDCPSVECGVTWLERKTAVQKATQGGPRDVLLHYNTMGWREGVSVADKFVLLVDDVVTSGSTLLAGERHALENKASGVLKYALACTAP